LTNPREALETRIADAERLAGTLHRSLTPYDILGYITPGGAFILAVLAFETWLQQVVTSNPTIGVRPPLDTPILATATRLLAGVPQGSTWATELFVVAVTVGVTYIVGHVIASVSALAIDRMYVAKAHGYPFRYLLDIPDEAHPATHSSNYYRGAFFWLNLYVLARHLSLPNAVAAAAFLPKPITHLLPSILGPSYWHVTAIVALILLTLATVVKLTASTSAKSREGLRHSIWASPSGTAAIRWISRALWLFALPANLITTFLANYLHTRQRLDEPSRKAFMDQVGPMLGIKKPDLHDSSTYWYAALRVRLGPPSIAEPAENWLRLYGFSRNLACALWLAFCYCSIEWLNFSDALQSTALHGKNLLYGFPLLLFALSFAMLLRYYYLYADYYTKYLLRAFVFLQGAKNISHTETAA
jgi:hypothetical protein